MRLEPLGRRVAEEDEAVEVDHRVRVDRDPERVGGAAGEVVGGEHDHDRQPVDGDLEDLARVAADGGAGERAARPRDHQLTLDRDPIVGAPGAEGDEVQAEGSSAAPRPSARSGSWRALRASSGELGRGHADKSMPPDVPTRPGLSPGPAATHLGCALLRVAVVDMGTNSTRLLIAEVVDGRVREIVRRSTVTRLGRGVDTSGQLSAEAIEDVCEVVASYVVSTSARAPSACGRSPPAPCATRERGHVPGRAARALRPGRARSSTAPRRRGSPIWAPARSVRRRRRRSWSTSAAARPSWWSATAPTSASTPRCRWARSATPSAT